MAVTASIGGSGDNAAIAVTVGGGSCSVNAAATGSTLTVSVAMVASTDMAAADAAHAQPDAGVASATATAKEPIVAGSVNNSEQCRSSLPSSWGASSQDLLLGWWTGRDC